MKEKKSTVLHAGIFILLGINAIRGVAGRWVLNPGKCRLRQYSRLPGSIVSDMKRRNNPPLLNEDGREESICLDIICSFLR
jgi:hypothetical protein